MLLHTERKKASINNLKTLVRAEINLLQSRHNFYIGWTFIVIQKKRDYFMAVRSLLFCHIIYIDQVCKKMPAGAIRALLVHELLHLRHPDCLNERKIDSKVVELGYGPQLLEFHKWNNVNYKKYKKKDGLTVSEINKMISNKNKPSKPVKKLIQKK